jgi:hypothetical protein
VNYQAWTLVAVWLGVLASVYVSIRSSGERKQQLRDLGITAAEHRTWLLTHDSRLNGIDVELAETRGFKKAIDLMTAHKKD